MTEQLTGWLRRSPWPPRLLLLAALCLLAVVLARLAWTLLAPPPEPGTGPTVLLATPVAPPPRLPLSTFHLLGTVGVGSSASLPNAPETQLNLSLVGLIGGRTPEDGLAIIADINGRQAKYAVGQTVGDSGAVLEAVYSDRVLLRFNGRQETLKRFRPGALGTPAGTPAPAVPSAPLPPMPQVSASNPGTIPTAPDPSNGFIGQTAGAAHFEIVRQQALADPAALLSQVQVVPVLEGGQLSGVRLGYSGDPALLQQAGLQPDDVIVAVNGMRIDSIERGMQVVEMLKTAGSVAVTVRRNGSEVALPAINLGR